MPPRILVVEDDPDNLDSLVELLRDEGYDVVPARTGQEAREQVASARPNLMIVDYMLPDTTGTELVGGLRGLMGSTQVPVVFLTAIVDGIDAAGAPVVTKPVAFDDLLAVLGHYCGPPQPAV